MNGEVDNITLLKELGSKYHKQPSQVAYR